MTLSALAVLAGAAPTRTEPTTSRACCLHRLCRAPAVADELCAKHIASVLIDSLEWLSRSEALVEWRFAHSGFVTNSLVSVEFERSDRSVGFEGGFTADGDCPSQVEREVEEAAASKAADDYEERDWDSEREYRDECRESRMEVL